MAPSREPVFNIPAVLLAVIAVLLAIQALRGIIAPDTDNRVVALSAFVPLRLTGLVDAAGVRDILAGWSRSSVPQDATRLDLAALFLREGTAGALPTLLTYALLHGGWGHVGLNSIWLLAFGTPVARRIGAFRFLALLGLCALAGALTHWALFPLSVEPLVGASAAVSGCMGAALRFAFQARPMDRPRDAPLPLLPLRAVLSQKQTLSFLLAWFVSNALFGIGSISFGLTDQPVAWQAHIGGFLAGILLFPLFDPPRLNNDGGRPTLEQSPCAPESAR